MRIILLFLAMMLAGTGLPQAAGFDGPGVQPQVTRAADVLQADDDAPCMLEGNILEKIVGRKNRYVFADPSGRIVVEIENRTFGPHTVTPADRVRLHGHVDWSRKHENEVEVDALEVIR